MAHADPIYSIEGATVSLTREEMYGLVNTAERLGALITDDGAAAEVFHGDQQAKGELEAFDDVSRAIGRVIQADHSPTPAADSTAARSDAIAAALAVVESLDGTLAMTWPTLATKLADQDFPAEVDPHALARLITALLAAHLLGRG